MFICLRGSLINGPLTHWIHQHHKRIRHDKKRFNYWSVDECARDGPIMHTNIMSSSLVKCISGSPGGVVAFQIGTAGQPSLYWQPSTLLLGSNTKICTELSDSVLLPSFSWFRNRINLTKNNNRKLLFAFLHTPMRRFQPNFKLCMECLSFRPRKHCMGYTTLCWPFYNQVTPLCFQDTYSRILSKESTSELWYLIKLTKPAFSLNYLMPCFLFLQGYFATISLPIA